MDMAYGVFSNQINLKIGLKEIVFKYKIAVLQKLFFHGIHCGQ